MKNIKTTICILIAGAITGCSKDQNQSPGGLNGKYSGKLVAVYKTDIWHTGPITSNVNVSFTNGHYNSVSLPFPSGYGAYTGSADSGRFVENSNQISLMDPLAYPESFDHGLILESTYTIDQKGDSLILSKSVAGNSYTYRLKKQ